MTHASGYPDYYPLDFVDRRMEKAIAPDRPLAYRFALPTAGVFSLSTRPLRG